MAVHQIADTPEGAPIPDVAASLRADRSEPVTAVHAGLVPYGEAWDRQRELVAQRAEAAIGDVLLTLEHPAVYTLGKRADEAHVLWDGRERARRGIELHRVDRGGDVTYHGPGQLVAYPILQLDGLRNVVDYVRVLETVCVRVAAHFGVGARPVPGYTGVWVGDAKLVAIGVRVSSHGVTSHGLAFNVTTDLRHFEGIVPCGISDRSVCSLDSLGVGASVDDVLRVFRAEFGEVLGCTVTRSAPDDRLASVEAT